MSVVYGNEYLAVGMFVTALDIGKGKLVVGQKDGVRGGLLARPLFEADQLLTTHMTWECFIIIPRVDNLFVCLLKSYSVLFPFRHIMKEPYQYHIIYGGENGGNASAFRFVPFIIKSYILSHRIKCKSVTR